MIAWIKQFILTWRFSSHDEPIQPRGPRWQLIMELALVCFFLLLYIWEPAEWLVGKHDWELARVIVRATAIAVGAICLIGSMVRLRENVTQLGLTRQAISSGWRPILIFTGISLALLAIGGVLVFDPMDTTKLGVWLARYVPAMMFQQLALQWFLNNRVFYLARGDERRRRIVAVTVSCGLFVLMHAPNPVLMGSVAWAGWYWCRHFREHRNIVALMVSHTLLGVASMMLMGETWLIHLRVGWPVITWLQRHPEWPM